MHQVHIIHVEVVAAAEYACYVLHDGLLAAGCSYCTPVLFFEEGEKEHGVYTNNE